MSRPNNERWKHMGLNIHIQTGKQDTGENNQRANQQRNYKGLQD